MNGTRLHLSDGGTRCRSVFELNGSAAQTTAATTERVLISNEELAEREFSAFPTSVPLWKRVLDVTCILVALPFLLPLILFIAVLIKIGSDGPVMFKQKRVGYRGKRFMLFKFRTMVLGADTTGHEGHCGRLISSNLPMVKMDVQGDPRLVPFGWLLRATGVDELPQIINVLLGEMTLVGPRPCLPSEYERYLPWQRERFNTLPGLTGLWQVSGKNRTTFVEMIHLDIFYARNKSLWLDLKIMLKTVPALIVQTQDMRSAIETIRARSATRAQSSWLEQTIDRRYNGNSPVVVQPSRELFKQE